MTKPKNDCQCGPCADPNYFTRGIRVMPPGLTATESKANAERSAAQRKRDKEDVDAMMRKAGFHPVTGKRLEVET